MYDTKNVICSFHELKEKRATWKSYIKFINSLQFIDASSVFIHAWFCQFGKQYMQNNQQFASSIFISFDVCKISIVFRSMLFR